jgi:hypothetical protein
MKLLRNPIFVVLLLVAAMAAAYSSLKPKSRPGRSSRPAAGAGHDCCGEGKTSREDKRGHGSRGSPGTAH